MTAHLYVNSKGFEVRSHSYSGGDRFHFCPQLYKLERVDGWKERRKSAAFEFGKALEEAIRVYHVNLNLTDGIAHFNQLWGEWRDKALDYTAVENSWEALSRSGQEMIRLYALRLPSFPIQFTPAPQFQIKYWKELFPGSEWAGLEFVAYVDMVAASRASLGDQLIVDIKTAGQPLDTTPGILALDQQLRTYAWVTGVPDVAFLWFQKTGRTLERGTEVSLLADADSFRAGQEVVVIKYQEYEPAKPADPEKPKSKPKPEVPEELWVVKDAAAIDAMFAKCGRGQTKEEKEAREAWIRGNAVQVAPNQVTRQRVTFHQAHIGLAEQAEAAEIIRHDVAQIVQANQDNYWPKLGSIRGMDKKCVRCPMRGICLNNPKLTEELVERADTAWDAQTEASE